MSVRHSVQNHAQGEMYFQNANAGNRGQTYEIPIKSEMAPQIPKAILAMKLDRDEQTIRTYMHAATISNHRKNLRPESMTIINNGVNHNTSVSVIWLPWQQGYLGRSR